MQEISTTNFGFAEINSNLSGYDVCNLEIGNDYFIELGTSREYNRNGITVVTFDAIHCIAVANSWIHCATLKSKPSIPLYINLFCWVEDSARINCKIETDGKVYFRSYSTKSNYCYGSLSFS